MNCHSKNLSIYLSPEHSKMERINKFLNFFQTSLIKYTKLDENFNVHDEQQPLTTIHTKKSDGRKIMQLIYQNVLKIDENKREMKQ